MWSEMATISPGANAGSTAPEALRDDQRPHAERGDDPHAEADLRRRVALVAVDAPAEQEHGLVAWLAGRPTEILPATSRPGWPATVVSGKPGSDA